MKKRIRKKADKCSHLVYTRFLVTDDPYPIYNYEHYCKLDKFDYTWERPENRSIDVCENCKRFQLTRCNIREKREELKRIKESERYYSKMTKEQVNNFFNDSIDIFSLL